MTFEEHDFFAPQTVEADAFFFRWSLRNWADKYCVLALRALIPKLKQGARVIIQDVILPEPGVGPLWKERNARFVIHYTMSCPSQVKLTLCNAIDPGICHWLHALTHETELLRIGKEYCKKQTKVSFSIRLPNRKALLWESWSLYGRAKLSGHLNFKDTPQHLSGTCLSNLAYSYC